MTTICYHHDSRTIAVDSRLSAGNTICSDGYDKIRQTPSRTFILAGDASDIETITKTYPSQLTYTPQASGFLIEDSVCYHLHYNEDGIPSPLELYWDEAVGSGGQYALAALDFGLTAREAVKYACTRDLCSGGKIRTIKIK